MEKYDPKDYSFSDAPPPESKHEENPMERSNVLCFPVKERVTRVGMEERQKLSKEQIKDINKKLHDYINNKKFCHQDILEFNKISGLKTDFAIMSTPEKKAFYYSFPLYFDGYQVMFRTTFRKFNKQEFDEDDAEDTNKMSSYSFYDFADPLLPERQSDGTFKLTIDMFYDHVIKWMRVAYKDHPTRAE
jgi:hypothetical protein